MQSLDKNLENINKKGRIKLLEELEQQYKDDRYMRIYLSEGVNTNGYQIDDHKPSPQKIKTHRGEDLPFIKVSRWKKLIRESLYYELKGELME